MTGNVPLPPPSRESFPRLELAWGLLLLAAGVGARLLFVAVFPTAPVSDFRGIIDFALDLRDKSLFVPGYYWDVFNLGPPLVLSVILRVFPADPESTARLATAVWCGLMPLFPYLLWRGILPLWVRVTTGALLALWPGQVFFSGVVAQDNWGLVPAVAMGCLAVRALLDPDPHRPGYPLAAGLLYAFCVAMRQEMLGALLPLLVAAGGFTRRAGWRPARIAACALGVGLPFLALCAQRQKVTGHFALSSGHAGFTLLGTVVPGATAVDWKDPVSYIASVEPGLVRDRHRMFQEAGRLGIAEVRRRPGFQALRVAAMLARSPFASDPELLYWSLVAPDTLPAPLQARGQAFAFRAMPLLKIEMLGIQIAFLTALGMGLARRNPAILFLAAAALLKVGLHSVLVFQARFFMPATGLELVAVGVGFWEIARSSRGSRQPAGILAGAALLAVGLVTVAPKLHDRVRSLDPDDEQRTYRFTLTSYQTPGALDCVVRRGRLTALGDTEATLETLRTRPVPGERAAAECVLRAGGAAGGALPPIPLAVEVLDGYEPGGQARQMFQRVEIDGREVWRHDLAATPGTGWQAAPAGPIGGGEE
ncbi:MAG TPA: hypothetical protein VHU81_04610, partial [Thermoanaerobaculia bacterium]|nr:hypothetical protein [Thermoanaerobaculia bacterium]